MHQAVSTRVPPEVPLRYAQLLAPVLPADFPWSDFVEASQRPLRPSVRVNPLKARVSDVRRAAAAHGWRLLEQVPWTQGRAEVAGQGFWIDPGSAARDEALPEVLREIPAGWSALAPEALQMEEDPFEIEEERTTVQWSRDVSRFAGDIYVQEAASMLPVAALVDAFPEGPPHGALVLDASAAPGGKTTAIAAWLAPVQGGVLANDINAKRSWALEDNLLRTGAMPWAAVSNVDAMNAGRFWPEAFNAVLVDAPCSGESMTRRGSMLEDKWLQADKYINHLSGLQKQMAASAVQALKVGGVLVYSTCTLNPVENEEVISFVERKFGDAVERMPLKSLQGTERLLTPEGHIRCWPHVQDTSGFFVARLRKVKSTEALNEPGVGFSKRRANGSKKKKHVVPGTIWAGGDGGGTIGKALEEVNKKDTKFIARHFAEKFGWELPKAVDGFALRKKAVATSVRAGRPTSEIWICPKALLPLRNAGIRRCGVRIVDVQRKNLSYTANFEWVVSFAHQLADGRGDGHTEEEGEALPVGTVHVATEAARAFCAGEDIEPNWGMAAVLATDGEQVVVKSGGHVLGLGRWSEGVIINETPPHWRCEEVVL